MNRLTQQRILETELLSMRNKGVSLNGSMKKEFNSNSERLAELSTLFSNNVLDATKDKLETIHGISESVADSLTEWKSDNENIKTMSSLGKHGFKFDKKAATSTGKLNGKTFVITGTLENYSRQDLINLIESLGGIVTTSVSKNTDILIAGKKSGTKLDKAKKLEIKIMNEDEALNYINK